MNLVEIVVRAKDETAAGLKEAKASSTTLGSTLQKVGMIGGVALAAIAVESVKMASKFDSAMEMIHTQAGVAQDKIAGLKAGVLALAGQVGFSPDSLAEGLYHIESSFASVGITGPKALDLLKVAAQGAAIGHASLVDTVNALDATVASGIGGVKNYGQAMGALNAIVGAGDMHMQDLNEAMGTGLMAVAKSYGQNITDVGAALATFGDNNIRGAHAATMLRMAMQALLSPAKAGQAELQSIGLSMTQLGTTLEHQGLTAAIAEFVHHLEASKVPVNEWGKYVTDIFGKKAGAGIGVLVDQLGRLQSKQKVLQDGAHSFGDAWQKTQQTASQQFAELKASVDSVMISIGEKLMPVVLDLLNFLNSHKSVLTTVAVAVGVLTAAITAYSIAAKVAAVVTALMEAPWVAVGLAIVVLAAIVIKYHTQIWDFIKKVWTDIWNFIKKTWDDIMSFAKQWWPLLLGPTGLILKYHNDLFNAIMKVWNAIEDFFKTAWDDILHAAESVWKAITSVFKDAGTWLVDAGKALIEGFIKGIESMGGALVDGFKSLLSHIPGGGIAQKALSFIGLAGGGAVGAAGGGARSNFVMVGEHGRELVKLPGGSTVMPNTNTESALAGAGGGAMAITIELGNSFKRLGLSQEQLEDLRYTIRKIGGRGANSVQNALGQA